MATIELDDLTEGSLKGSGVFDRLMQTVKAHLDEEYKQNRIKGSDFSTVYLGAMTTILEQSSGFLLAKEKVSLESQLMEQQILLAQKEVEKADAQIELVRQQTQNALAELAIIQANASKVAAEVALMEVQARKVEQDILNSVKEASLIDVQKAKLEQDTLNAVTEGANLVKQGCLLDAQYDLTMEQKLKVASETTLLAQKLVTERAQTVSSAVDPDSVMGQQKKLYEMQAAGYKRDAEQKAARILTETWQVRKTTDAGTLADSSNKLANEYIGMAITKLLEGIEVTV